MASVEKYALLNRREITKKRGNYTVLHMGMFSSSFFKLLAMFVQSGSKPEQKGCVSSCYFMLWHPELTMHEVQVSHTEVSALNQSCVAQSVGILTLALSIFLSMFRKYRATARV